MISMVQGLYECGIFSIFLPGSKVPGWFSHQILGSSMSFDLPPLLNHKIQGLFLCVVYEFRKSMEYKYVWIESAGF